MSTVEARVFAGYEEKFKQYVREVEGMGDPSATGAIYVDVKGIPTVGYGFALLVGNAWGVTGSIDMLPRPLTEDRC